MNAEELEKLHNLRKKGIITEEEFNSQKNKLLNNKKQSTFLWLALFLSAFGIHNFYVGQTIRGIVKIILWALSVILSVAFPMLLFLSGIPALFLWLWVVIEMFITDKTASGVNLIPASTACKVAVGIIIGISFILNMIYMKKIVDIFFLLIRLYGSAIME